jgi:hypothetical protein
MKKNKVISDWLDKYNDLEIDKKVKMKLEEITKERSNQIIDEVYNKYTNKYVGYEDIPSKELFLFEIKNNPEFSERWGLKIEERELSWEDRKNLLTPEQYDGTALNKYGHKDCGFGDISPFTDKVIHYWMNLHNIPTKLITITYNDTKIQSYE